MPNTPPKPPAPPAPPPPRPSLNSDRKEAEGLRQLTELRQRNAAAIGDQTRRQNELRAASSQSLEVSSAASREAINQLQAQGAELEKLNVTRKQMYEEEVERSTSLIQHYENVHIALREMGEDSEDTSTILGSMVENVQGGVDHFQEYGDVVSDSVIVMNDFHATIPGVANSILAVGTTLDAARTSTQSFIMSASELHVNLTSIDARLGLVAGTAEKASQGFRNLAHIKLNTAAAVAEVSNVTEAMLELSLQGVTVEHQLAAIDVSSGQTGRTFEQSTTDIGALTLQSHLLGEQLGKTKNILQGFAGVVRDDYVRSITEATRNLNSQVLSLQDVGAMYSILTEKAAAFGLSREGAAKASTGVMSALTTERNDTVTFLTGQRLQAEFRRKMAKKAGGAAALARLSEEQKRKLSGSVFTGMGINDEATQSEMFRGRNEGGMGSVAFARLAMGSTSAIRAQMASVRKLSQGMGDAVGSMQVNSMLHTDNLSELQQRQIYRMVQDGGNGEDLATRIQNFQEESARAEREGHEARNQAVNTINHMRHPVDSLLSIEKAIIASLTKLSNISSVVDYIGSFLGHSKSEESIRHDVETSVPVQEAAAHLQDTTAAAQEAQGHLAEVNAEDSHATDEEKRAAQEALDAAQAANGAAQQAYGQVVETEVTSALDAEEARPLAGGLVGAVGGAAIDSLPAPYRLALHGLISAFSSSDDEGEGSSESGRTEGSTQLSQQNREASVVASGSSSGARSSSGNSSTLPSTTPGEGEVEGAGDGTIETDAAGQTHLNLRVKIDGVPGVVAAATSQQNSANRLNGTSG